MHIPIFITNSWGIIAKEVDCSIGVSEFKLNSCYQLIGQVGRAFINGPGDLGSVPGRVIPKTLRMVLDTSLLNTQYYKVHIKGKVEQSRERSRSLSNITV